MSDFGPPEHVYVENEWYDGPRAGVADVQGVPHRFRSEFDHDEDDYLGTYLVWPISPLSLQLEIEQWQIYVAWNELFEAGKVDTDSHPGHGGLNERYDEIRTALQSERDHVPPDAKKAKAEIEFLGRERRYADSGAGYKLRWKLL